MAVTKINLDRQSEGRVLPLGTTAAAGQALLTLNNGTAGATNVVLDVKGSASVVGDINLTGNLNITGSVDTQSVTNTNVKDKTITVNDGGTTAGAAGGGILVEGDAGATIGALTFATGAAGKFQIGDGTTQVDVVTTSGTQTLTNKSITGGQVTSAVANATLAASATSALGLKSATTTIDVQTATAPTAGQVLTATSGTAATWQNGGAGKTFTRTTVTGTINGTNTAFTLGVTPNPAGSEMIMQNGMTLLPGSGNDYTITNAAVTFAVAPATGDQLQAFASS